MVDKIKTEERARRLKWFRFFTAQIISLCLLVMLFTRAIFQSPLLVQICFFIIAISTGILNYYFIKEIKTIETSKYNTIMFNQIIITITFLLFGIFCVYRGMTVNIVYRQLIAYGGGAVSFILFGLSLWGIKYAKKK